MHQDHLALMAHQEFRSVVWVGGCIVFYGSLPFLVFLFEVLIYLLVNELLSFQNKTPHLLLRHPPNLISVHIICILDDACVFVCVIVVLCMCATSCHYVYIGARWC